MSSFFSNKRLIVLLVCMIILVALIGYSMSDRRSLSWPEQFVADTVGSLQSAFSRPAHFAAGFFDNVRDMRNLYEENQLLKSHLDEYATLQVELNQLQRRNEELEAAVDLQDDPDLMSYTVRSAIVIHRSPDRWNEQVGINKGAQDGLEENMAVITSEGLIGKIDRVSQFSSTIRLLSDQDITNRISAMVDTDDETVFGFIEGMDEETGYLRFTKIDMEAELENGQTVSTSGLGGVFPQGLQIGKIVEYDTDEFGLTQTAYVEPSANFSRLDYVMVVERGADTLEEKINPDLEDDDS
ncbi:rod shape-determining protein MreC [Salipaludibacillus sp. LMS25]|jgi:rod shape-determining protein MreC|uniref:rod shape-determining protein MreC n=1 Tax=Salipaludibacillus sp. LMS25 TaxID=2924031 RepID=UPI0020D0DDCE|nr:rod shape-determining protein MreC [Salipaludibacillus sp. LMS25]UTR15466.1 rod shape-determining protein MreC [Salipaludibacillus sp. LMS25]